MEHEGYDAEYLQFLAFLQDERREIWVGREQGWESAFLQPLTEQLIRGGEAACFPGLTLAQSET